MRVHYLQHEPFEGLGSMEAWFRAHGATLSSTHLYRGEALPELASYDWLVLMGGGMSVNDFTAQFQADISDIEVVRPRNIETTSMGAAYMAGLSAGFWKSTDEISEIWKAERSFRPSMAIGTRSALRRGWEDAVNRARTGHAV